jgi:ATP/maltotriose-dependent transcriptional regulator MalT
MMATSGASLQGREAYARRQWREAHARFAAADRESRLAPDDLERFAAATWLVGRETDARTTWIRAHHELIDEGRLEDAARTGFWLSLCFLLSGEVAQATGWHARSQRLLNSWEEPSAARGYGLVVTGLLAMSKGDMDSARASFEAAATLAGPHGDADLLALALLGQGEMLTRSGSVGEGVARLDEAMVAVTAGDVSPVLAGIVYCAVILACQAIFDLNRAQEWTRQFDAWCGAQADLVPYRGQCLVHRSEVLQFRGEWGRALAEVMHAREHLADRAEAVVGRACYQQGELHRLRGEFGEAEAMYREAARHGCEPQPGVSLLRLARGEVDAAAASIRAAIDSGGGAHARLLGPGVELLLAAGELEAAREAADELCRLASKCDAPLLQAVSAQARARLLTAEGNGKAALELLRQAWSLWQDLEAPYECARVRTLIGCVYRDLGDHETARMHFDAAAPIFAELGAAPDIAGLERLTGNAHANPAGALTCREREVLARVAAGETNRQIAATLAISEHTVARHLSNIFDKLGVTTRTAAATLAHKRNLI